MRISIVTPVLNGALFLDETILSVVTQSGRFSIRYHVQDGGSTDGTLDKLAQWKARLAADFPILCGGIEFTYSSEPDKGLYDAINRGFTRCGNSDLMTWINADDRFEPGAFQSVACILDNFPDIHWLCGRVTIIDQWGMLVHRHEVIPFPQLCIMAGLFDERHAPPIIQQEGTFWRSGLWRLAGGLNADFRVAGDFDLWRRFAMHTDLAIADATFACWRRLDGQLSADKTAYQAEIDRSLSPREKELRAETAARYGAIMSRDGMREAGFSSRVLVRRNLGHWVCDVMPSHVFGRAPILRSVESAEVEGERDEPRTRPTAPRPQPLIRGIWSAFICVQKKKLNSPP
jgi:glycosyltransferase involved in cell wall biosynthesis